MDEGLAPLFAVDDGGLGAVFAALAKPPLNYIKTNHTAWGSPHTDVTTLLAEPIKYSNPLAASSNVSLESEMASTLGINTPP